MSDSKNTMALVAIILGGVTLFFSFCCGPLSFVSGLAGVVCGFLGVSEANKQNGNGKGMAMGGIGLSIFGMGIYIAFLVLGVAIGMFG